MQMHWRVHGHMCQQLFLPLRVLPGTAAFCTAICVQRRESLRLWSVLLFTHTSTYDPCSHVHTQRRSWGDTDLCFRPTLQPSGAKPNEPTDTALIPIIFLRIRLQICSSKVVCQAGKGCPVNGEEGSREQPEKSGVRLTFWREPSTHSYY